MHSRHQNTFISYAEIFSFYLLFRYHVFNFHSLWGRHHHFPNVRYYIIYVFPISTSFEIEYLILMKWLVEFERGTFCFLPNALTHYANLTSFMSIVGHEFKETTAAEATLLCMLSFYALQDFFDCMNWTYTSIWHKMPRQRIHFNMEWEIQKLNIKTS